MLILLFLVGNTAYIDFAIEFLCADHSFFYCFPFLCRLLLHDFYIKNEINCLHWNRAY